MLSRSAVRLSLDLTMRASQTNKPQPMPLPPPPLSLPSTPSTTPRRRSRTASSSSSSSSVSTVSTFSPSSSPAPSPRTTTTATSVVPFSWERRPGQPKSSLTGLISSSAGSTPLPLPPPALRPSPRRCRQRRRRRAVEAPEAAADPFVAAFVECTREEGMDDDDADADDKLWPAPTATASGRTARPWRVAGGGGGLLGLYGCRSAMDVVDGAFLARRPVAPPPRPEPCRGTRR